MAVITYREALNRALREEMRRDGDVFLLGEEVGEYDGAYKVSKGLLDEFGVIDRGDSPGFSIDTLNVRHDTLFIVWHAESMHHVFPFGTDTFVCAGDKVKRQSIAFTPPRPKSTPTGVEG